MCSLALVLFVSEWNRRMTKPEKTVTDAVERAQYLLAKYIGPGPRDCGEAIGKLMDILT
jgi:hypothetical protein